MEREGERERGEREREREREGRGLEDHRAITPPDTWNCLQAIMLCFVLGFYPSSPLFLPHDPHPFHPSFSRKLVCFGINTSRPSDRVEARRERSRPVPLDVDAA